MKLSIFTVSTPDLTPEELALAAKEAGIAAIEWRYKEVPEDAAREKPSYWRNNLCSIDPAGDERHLDRFKQAAEAQGLQSASVAPYLTPGDLEGTEKVLRAARYLNASSIRLGVPGYNRTRHYNELFELERQYLREAESLCKQFNIKGVIETHHQTIAATASASLRLCEGLDPDFIGVLYDPGNMVYEGFENYRMGLELLGPYLAHVHVKNAGWHSSEGADGGIAWKCEWTGIQKGMVPWKQVIEDLESVGYDGYLGVEDFSGEFGSREMLLQFSEYLNGLQKKA